MKLVYGSICLKCNKKLMLGQEKEKQVYYIGDDEIRFCVYVAIGICPGCGFQYEDSTTKSDRKEALKKALDRYWFEKLGNMTTPDKIMQIKNLFQRLINGSSNRKRRMSEELGLWLTGQHFPPEKV